MCGLYMVNLKKKLKSKNYICFKYNTMKWENIIISTYSNDYLQCYEKNEEKHVSL